MATIGQGTTYTQTVVTAPSAPSTETVFDITVNRPLIRELVASGIYDEPQLQMEMNSSRSFFTGQGIIKSNQLLSNLKFGQKIKLIIEKDQNPLGLFQKNAMEYDEVDACHDQIALDCSVPCINTLPDFDYLIFAFDCEYAYGVRACDKDKDFWNFEFVAKQYAKSRQAYQFGREVDLWNTVIKGLIAAPAATADAFEAAVHPTHYWANLGTVAAKGRKEVTEAYQYFRNTFVGVNPYVFITREFAQELIASVENPYNLNLSQVMVNTYKEWSIPGFEVSDAVSTILGGVSNIVIMKRSPWLTVANEGALTSTFPLWSSDATKQYVAILDPRVGYSFEKDGYHLDIKPYDCDKLIRGMIDTVYTGSGITFPQYGMILEFSQWDHSAYVGA